MRMTPVTIVDFYKFIFPILIVTILQFKFDFFIYKDTTRWKDPILLQRVSSC